MEDAAGARQSSVTRGGLAESATACAVNGSRLVPDEPSEELQRRDFRLFNARSRPEDAGVDGPTGPSTPQALGVVTVGTTVVTGVVAVTVHAPPAVLPGESFDIVVRASAKGGPVVSGAVTLINRVTFRHRQFNAFGGASTATADRAEVVDEQHVLPVRLDDGPSSIGAITMRVPVGALPSVAGDLVQISWRVVVRLHVLGEGDAVASQSVRVLSAAADDAFVSEQPPRMFDRRTATLNFPALFDRRLRPHSILAGCLDIVPLKTLTGRAVRVELILLEQIHHGTWVGRDDPTVIPPGQGMEAETAVATATIATGLRMERHRRSFPFSLAVPELLPGPSLDTPEFSLRWLLRGVLDRAHRPDPFVEIDLHAVTATD